MSDQFTFDVTNNTESAIVELWASPDVDADQELWSQFTLGDEGIPPGETVTIAWAEYTNDSPCEWYISAVFDDDSETEAVVFNFCEEDLELVIG